MTLFDPIVQEVNHSRKPQTNSQENVQTPMHVSLVNITNLLADNEWESKGWKNHTNEQKETIHHNSMEITIHFFFRFCEMSKVVSFAF